MPTISSPFWAHQPFFGSGKPQKMRHADHSAATIQQLRRDSEETHKLRKNSEGAISPTATSPATDVFIPRAVSPIPDSDVDTVDSDAAAQKKAEKAERERQAAIQGRQDRKREAAIQRRQERMQAATEELKEKKNNSYRGYLQAIQETGDVIEPAALHLAPFVKAQFEKNDNFQRNLLSPENAPSEKLYRLANAAIRASSKPRGEDLPAAYGKFFDAVTSVPQYQDFINAGEATLRKTLGF